MSHHCHDEHDGHSNSHSHGGDDGGHDHSDDITPAIQHSLYQHIDFDGITTLNEATPGSGAAVVKKTWAERLEVVPEVESDADEQLLMHIPSVSPVRRASHVVFSLQFFCVGAAVTGDGVLERADLTERRVGLRDR